LARDIPGARSEMKSCMGLQVKVALSASDL
jgi:hypothetical protein